MEPGPCSPRSQSARSPSPSSLGRAAQEAWALQVSKKPRLTPALEAAEAWALQKAHIDEEVRLAEEEVRRAEAGVLDKKVILLSHQIYQKLAARAVAEGLPAEVSVEEHLLQVIDYINIRQVLRSSQEHCDRLADLLGTQCSQLGYALSNSTLTFRDWANLTCRWVWRFEKKASDNIVRAPSFH